MTATGPEGRTCQSRSPYGNCGLVQKHAGDHAVPLGEGLWFGYPRNRSKPVMGYCHIRDGRLVAIS